ncbi:hypothetical protein [Actinocorallia longicatena]|uniref:Uncharacterized protein n=1 Tax=Actinocorallia longicatena TaxID=111803 RepID=A0ABP6QE31_9ACTN
MADTATAARTLAAARLVHAVDALLAAADPSLPDRWWWRRVGRPALARLGARMHRTGWEFEVQLVPTAEHRRRPLAGLGEPT